jgi:sterol desaturase/sphingolipid hydroxylase (fatty acid hydroxylase superfamily)
VSNKIASTTLSSGVRLWIHFLRAHLNPIGGASFEVLSLTFSSRNHHLTLNPKLRITFFQVCACSSMHAVHHPNMAFNYWQLALDVQNEL